MRRKKFVTFTYATIVTVASVIYHSFCKLLLSLLQFCESYTSYVVNTKYTFRLFQSRLFVWPRSTACEAVSNEKVTSSLTLVIGNSTVGRSEFYGLSID